MLYVFESRKGILKIIEIFASLVSTCNFYFNRQCISPSCYSKSRHVGRHHRAWFKSNLKLFECLGVPIGPIGTSTRSKCLLYYFEHRFDGNIGWPNLKYKMGSAGLYGHKTMHQYPNNHMRPVQGANIRFESNAMVFTNIATLEWQLELLLRRLKSKLRSIKLT